MLLHSRPAVCVQPLRREVIQHGIVLLRLLYRQDAAGATLCHPDCILFLYRVRHWIRRHRFCVPWKPSTKQSVRLLRLFGNTTSQRVMPSVGAEQEYFLVDRDKYLQRKDLIYTGRTLFGAMPPKGQEMDDHYFGAIRERIAAYMQRCQ